MSEHYHVIATLEGEQFVSQPIRSIVKAKNVSANVNTSRLLVRCNSPIEKGDDFCAKTYAGAAYSKEGKMDRAALIARLRTGHPTQLTLEAANALASDAKLLEELKRLCDDRVSSPKYSGVLAEWHYHGVDTVMGKIRAIFGWDKER